MHRVCYRRKHKCVFLFTILLMIFLLPSCGSMKESAEDISRSLYSAISDEEQALIEDMGQLREYVIKEIASGRKDISFRTTALSLETIQNINQELDGFYGIVEKCESIEYPISDVREIILHSSLDDNYYVEEYLLNGKEIPGEEWKAKELAAECRKILSKMDEELGKDPSPYAMEKWIHDYIIAHTVYGYPDDEEGSESLAHESYGALVKHLAVCNGYAFAMKLLCDIKGIPCSIITGSSEGENHAWNQVCLDGSYYHVDVTWDDPTPDQEGRILYTYFNVDDERMALGHQWIREKYPAAQGQYYNYYRLNSLYCADYSEFVDKVREILKDGDRTHFQLMVGDYDKDRYSNENMSFIFDSSDVKSLNYQTVGEGPYVSLYFTLEY